MHDRILAVGIDLDGTLLDTAEDLANAANGMLEQLGFPRLPMERLQSFIGNGMLTMTKRSLSNDFDGEPPAALVEQGLALFRACYDATLLQTTRTYPGVEQGLALLRTSGIRLACITNKPERYTRPLLAATGLLDAFDLVISGDSLLEKKPHPLPLLHAGEQLQVSMRHFAMIGDSRNDVAAARNAGCYSVVLPYGYRHGDAVEQLGADYLARDLLDAAHHLLTRITDESLTA